MHLICIDNIFVINIRKEILTYYQQEMWCR